MIETLVPAVREQLEAPDTAYVKACLERLTGREKLEEQEALEQDEEFGEVING